MITRLLISTLAGAIVIFVQAGFFFGYLFADFFAGTVAPKYAVANKESPEFAIIIVADAIYALMLSILISIRPGMKTFMRGAAIGLLVGFVFALHFDLITAATTYLKSFEAIVVNTAISSFMSGLGAGVIGYVLGRAERS
ncbi:MAG: hypothetical protein WBO10_16990 [Pyrinomonadaceae bacterium]